MSLKTQIEEAAAAVRALEEQLATIRAGRRAGGFFASLGGLVENTYSDKELKALLSAARKNLRRLETQRFVRMALAAGGAFALLAFAVFNSGTSIQ